MKEDNQEKNGVGKSSLKEKKPGKAKKIAVKGEEYGN